MHIIDLRCLQDPDYAERGIGTHARMAVTSAPPFTGIYDPTLPALPPDIAARAQSLSPHAYIPGLRPGDIFLNPSPMTKNQNFIAALLTNRNITRIACVYDFIPFDDPAHYLTHPITRLDYFAAMAWLHHYDSYRPISAPTAARLQELYGAVPTRITGVALPGWLENIPPTPCAGHILMVGGEDSRKNPEILAAAWSGSEILRARPLIITGHQSPATQTALSALGVTLPGKLPIETLRTLYAAAWCVVTPSRAEGFSMPVIEAAAAGAPSLASDIPAHRALLAREHLFPTDDPAALRTLLDSITPKRRAAIIDSQRSVAAQFTPSAVAAALWSAESPAIINITPKPKLAIITPLPPTRSGVADYSAATIAALRPLCDVSVFTEPTAIPYLSAGRYDAVLTVIGNSPTPAYDLAIRHGSAILCHDSRLLGLATSKGLAHAARLAATELNRPVSESEILSWVEDESCRQTPFLSELSAARPAIFHTAAPARWLHARYGTPTHHLPFAIYRPFEDPITPAMRAAARAQLGWPETQKIVCSFGFIGRAKAIAAALHAMTFLPDTRLHFVGADSDGAAPIRDLATQLGLQSRVSFANSYVSESAYRTHLLAADAALQLRETTGNISGALSDCIAAGLPAVATADLAENLTAPPYITRVNNDPRNIATALAAILTNPPNTESERTSYCETHSMKNYAENLLRILNP